MQELYRSLGRIECNLENMADQQDKFLGSLKEQDLRIRKLEVSGARRSGLWAGCAALLGFFAALFTKG